MRFNKLIMSNFGPFKDAECIDFTDKNGITIIWGDNGRGKTTILNAFNFLFFHEIRDRKGNTKDYFSYLNKEGYKSGNYTFCVELDISSDDDHLLVKRVVTPRQGISIPQNNDDLIQELFVNRNGMILDQDESNHIITQLMPADVSRFFFFDGELLQEYEDLLDDKSNTGKQIKKSIEQILGIPILKSGASDSKNAAERYSTEYSNAARNDERTKRFANTLDLSKAQLKAHEDEIDRLNKEREKADSNRRASEEEAKQNQAYRDLLTKKSVIQKKIQELKDSRDLLMGSATMSFSDAWKWMLKKPVDSLIASISKEVMDIEKHRSKSENNAEIIKLLKKSLEDNRCALCDRELSDEEFDMVNNKIVQLKKQKPDLSSDQITRLEIDQSRIVALQSMDLKEDKLEDLINTTRKISDLNISISNMTMNDLEEINTDLLTYKDCDDDVFKPIKDIAAYEKDILFADNKIEGEKAAANECERTIKGLEKQIRDCSSSDDITLANKKLNIADHIYSIFNDAIDVYREKLRKQVEKDATEIGRAHV